MIAHVAQAGEARGRVILRLGPAEPAPVAVDAALVVARAFGSELEGLFVESSDLIRMAAFPFAREIGLGGRQSRLINPEDVERDMRLVSHAIRRRIEAMAREFEVPFALRIVRGEPLSAVVSACAQCGPWNVVALGEPFTAVAHGALAQLLSAVTDATGVLLVGPKTARTRGPVVLAIEEASQLAAMLHAAERIAPLVGGDIVALLVAGEGEALADLEAQVRLILGEREDVAMATAEPARGETAVVAEAIRRLQGGFLLASFGGLAVPEHGSLAPLAAALECPLLVVR